MGQYNNWVIKPPTKQELDLIAGNTNYANKQLTSYVPFLKEEQADLAKQKDALAKEKISFEKKASAQLNAKIAFDTYVAANPTDKTSPTYIAKQKAKNDTYSAFTTASAAYKKLQNEVTATTENVKNVRTYVTSAAKALGLDAKTLLADVKTPGSSSGGGGGGKSDKKDVVKPWDGKRPKQGYKYNAPMVKYAYFNSSDGYPLATAFTDYAARWPQKFKDGNKAFRPGAQNSRGVIQMTAATVWNINHQAPLKKGEKGLDKTPFGFRFHYNPQFLTMSYGMANGVSAEEISSGKDNINPVVPLSSGSSFSVRIPLNRTEDLNFIRADGTLDPKSGLEIFGENGLYPEDVSFTELQAIYNKGTMYDIEYLFKACNGGRKDYNSLLRGPNSDHGWISGAAVECHFGSNLRYLGQLVSVNINHIHFNERMVPILSYVDLQFKRFYDTPSKENVVPEAYKVPSSSGGGGRNQAVL
jgi:hypothetical protein